MKLLLDTHLLLWAAGFPEKLSQQACAWMGDEHNQLLFSAASIWEVTIKNGLGKPDFSVDPHLLRRGLMENGYEELSITSRHTLGVGNLPDIHRDPFDRLLVAQAEYEGIMLLTNDGVVASYPGPIRKV